MFVTQSHKTPEKYSDFPNASEWVDNPDESLDRRCSLWKITVFPMGATAFYVYIDYYSGNSHDALEELAAYCDENNMSGLYKDTADLFDDGYTWNDIEESGWEPINGGAGYLTVDPGYLTVERIF